ncbi:hypothetical protein CDAR_209411 [Caerostris darwini]|uniref:Uncharacterized protein n=1 Tax=Caerostris darwini TaxID=1538125 RepID=A0AAV4N543_9ARAC|nr:hypothetical protein CDAR_209411 [Caerostris darwini]
MRHAPGLPPCPMSAFPMACTMSNVSFSNGMHHAQYLQSNGMQHVQWHIISDQNSCPSKKTSKNARVCLDTKIINVNKNNLAGDEEDEKFNQDEFPMQMH